jgi:VWFA-related protein
MAAEEEVVFRSDVSLVRVDVQVLEANRPIVGLRAGDFVLREAGRVQEIRNFATEEVPLDLLMLFDVSVSMRPHIERVVEASGQALRAMGAQDRVGVMVFDRATAVRMPFRNVRDSVEAEMRNVIRQERFNGGTDITRALLAAADHVGRAARRDARRAIVIVTDDRSERGRDEGRVLQALTRADAVLSALIAPDATARIFGGGPRPRPGLGTGWPSRYPQQRRLPQTQSAGTSRSRATRAATAFSWTTPRRWRSRWSACASATRSTSMCRRESSKARSGRFRWT